MKKKLLVGICLLAVVLLVAGYLFLRPMLPLLGLPAPEDTRLSIRAPEGRPLRIAQFADLHFGTEGLDYHNDQEQRTVAYMNYIVETGKPDLIVCTGDNIMNSGVAGVEEFIGLMDSLKTPWVFMYGNHDCDGGIGPYSKEYVSRALAASNSPYLLYNEGYVETGRENRYGNFTVSVMDHTGEKMLGALFFFDSGSYLYDEGKYQAITEGQIAWYKAEVDRLQAIYAAQDGNLHETVPSIGFGHMPLPEFHIACAKAANGDGAEFIIAGRGFGGGAAKPEHSLFDAMVEKGSAKAYFVGHYHVASYQVKMDGVVLGFGPQTGFSHKGYDSLRSTYIYSLNADFSFTTEDCKEPG